MAVLNNNELADLRRRTQREWSTDIDFDKSVANAALQAMEDWYEDERTVVSGLIITATSPKAFTAAEKKLIAKHFLAWKFQQGG